MGNVILLSEDRLLTEIELKYRYKFLAQMQDYDCELKEGEVFRQMLLTVNDYKAYNPEWFISNHATILTVSRKNIQPVKPQLNFRLAKKEETLDNKWTDRIKAYYPNWQEKYDAKEVPKDFYVTNSYPSTNGLRKSSANVQMHKLVYAYFVDANKAFMHGEHIHHKVIVNWNQSQEEMNRWDNLLAVPDSPHLLMHGLTAHIAELLTGLNSVNDKLYDVKIDNLDYYVAPLGIPDPQCLFHYRLDSQGKIEWLKLDE